MANSIVMKSFYAGLAAFVLCMISATAGGMTWGATVAGWVVFFSVVLSVAAGIGAFCWQVELAAQTWRKERNDTIDRMQDAQRCIKAEENAHERTKRELVDVRQQVQKANAEASQAKTEYENMRQRAAERGRTIDQLQTKISADNDQWRKQVSAVREAAYNMAVHIEGSANGLPDEWQEWGAELARDLRALAGAAGVQNDNRQVTIDEALAEPANPTPALVQVMGRGKRAELVDYSQDLPQCQPTPLHAVQVLLAKVRANQQQRRDRLNMVYEAIENGYELSQAITIAYSRGALWVSDELIADEVRHIAEWRAKGGDTAGSADPAI